MGNITERIANSIKDCMEFSGTLYKYTNNVTLYNYFTALQGNEDFIYQNPDMCEGGIYMFKSFMKLIYTGVNKEFRPDERGFDESVEEIAIYQLFAIFTKYNIQPNEILTHLIKSSVDGETEIYRVMRALEKYNEADKLLNNVIEKDVSDKIAMTKALFEYYNKTTMPLDTLKDTNKLKKFLNNLKNSNSYNFQRNEFRNQNVELIISSLE